MTKHNTQNDNDTFQPGEEEIEAPKTQKNVKKYFHALKGNQEAQALAYFSGAQGLLVGGSIILQATIVKLAENSAGCTGLESYGECTNRIYGLKPSSFLTLLNAIAGFCTSIMLPIIGGMVDTTPYRRGISILTATYAILNQYIFIMLSEKTWFICALFACVSSVNYFILTTVMYAYIPELTSDPDEQTNLNSIFLVLRGVVIVPYYILLGVLTYFILGFKNLSSIRFQVGLSRIATALEGVLLTFFVFKTFYKGVKPRARKKDAAESLSKTFSHLRSTAVEIYNNYPPLFWYIMALAPFGNTIASMPVLTITFVTFALNGNTSENLLIATVFLIFGVVGSRLQPMVSKRVGVLNDLRLYLAVIAGTCILCGLIVNKPERKRIFYLFTICFGVEIGLVTPSMRTIFFLLMPKGREVQFSGIYMCFSTGFSFIPPLIFTILNEVGVRMNILLALFSTPFIFAALLLSKVGSIEDAMIKNKERERQDVEEVMTP